ncbi:Ig-like domain-containing protein [Candidatus Leptofilum sp.]|uniref:Ig-like domain-containing protein n=1 Tax=Candidatus Leptofilum sp. TaxID=3241576 RepID=UPI003B592571
MLQLQRLFHLISQQTALFTQRYFSHNQTIGNQSSKIRKMVILAVVLTLFMPMTVFAAAPVFTANGPFTITENSSTGTFVGQVVATDATTYAITAGNGTGGGAFTIDNSGIINVADGTQLDFEVTPQFSLTVAATNTDGTTSTTVIVNIQNVNDSPQMDQASYEFATDENLPNGSLVGTVSATDSDPGDNIVYMILPGPVTAFAIDSDDGEIRIVDANQIDFESGTTMYTIYVLASDGGLFDMAPVEITINDANDAPVAVDDGTYNATEDTLLNVSITANGVLANDTDQDQNPVDVLTAVLDTQAANGTVNLNADGTFTYMPDSQFDGTDTFTYHANDGSDDSNIATVTISVSGTNDDPTANDDTYATDEDTVYTVSLPADGLLDNDTDPENDSLSVTASDATSSMGAAVSVNSDGTFSYDPTGSATIQALDAGDNTADTFDYTISDGDTGTDTGTVTINLTGVNDAPVSTNDGAYNATEDVQLNVNRAAGVLVNDTDVDADDIGNLTAVVNTTTSNGTLTLNADGSFTYMPNTNYNGSDSFTYFANDGTVNSGSATVTINIASQNDDPNAIDDGYTVDENSSNNTLTVLSNDTNPDDGETLTITAVGATSNGGTAVNNSPTITYTPAPGYVGQETFTYTISDGNGRTDTATVTITVNDVNEAPIITEGTSTSVIMDEDASPTAFSLTLNATDGDGDTITWSIQSQGTIGTASASGTGASKAIGYTPNANMNGSDSFVVRVSDGRGGMDDITVNVTINEQNDDPDAVDDSPSVNEQSSDNSLYPLVNDSIYPDTGETLTITAVGPTDNGGTVVNNGTSLTYTPDVAFIGTETFTYTIGDGRGGTDTATISVNVDDVNFSPVITEGTTISVTMDEDGSPTPFNLTLNATDPDADTITWSIQSGASNGTASVSGTGTSKTVNYTPTTNYNGSDSFMVRITDGQGGVDAITVNVTIDPINDDPTAVDDTQATPPDTAVTINVLDNDTDPEDDGLTITAVTQGSKGSVSHNGSTVTYTPNPGEIGTDTFTYTISDGTTGNDTGTVTVQLGLYKVFMPAIVNNFVSAPDLVVTNINASSDLIEVTIENQGTQATSSGFWVDFYIAPDPMPTQANEQWSDVAAEGIVWGVDVAIPAGGSLTLSYSTAPGALNLYYSEADSSYSGNLPDGTSVYAQVDSAHLGTTYGGVLETHEILGEIYNNVSAEFIVGTALPPTGDDEAAAQFIGQPLALPLR